VKIIRRMKSSISIGGDKRHGGVIMKNNESGNNGAAAVANGGAELAAGSIGGNEISNKAGKRHRWRKAKHQPNRESEMAAALAAAKAKKIRRNG